MKPYEVRDLITEQFIESMRPADVLPSERSLAKTFGVSRTTVRAALKLLQDDGVLRSAPGIGTFVAAPHLSKAPVLSSFSEDIRARGWRPGSRVLGCIARTADVGIANDLGIDPGEQYFELSRVRLADDVPLSVERVCLPAERVPDLPAHELAGSLYALLRAEYNIRVTRHDRRITAVSVDEENAELLDVAPRSAALYVVQNGWDQYGRQVEHGRSLYRGDRYDFMTVAYAQDAHHGR